MCSMNWGSLGTTLLSWVLKWPQYILSTCILGAEKKQCWSRDSGSLPVLSWVSTLDLKTAYLQGSLSLLYTLGSPDGGSEWQCPATFRRISWGVNLSWTTQGHQLQEKLHLLVMMMSHKYGGGGGGVWSVRLRLVKSGWRQPGRSCDISCVEKKIPRMNGKEDSPERSDCC